jgi:hypothetical protein
MERRELLLGLTSLLVTPTTVLAGHVRQSSDHYRWTSDGRVFRRHGESWVESISLGPEIQVFRIDDFDKSAVLTAVHAGRRFQLKTRDGRRWRAV